MIELENVRKGYGGKPPVTAVDGISFTCKPGRVFALLGPNGSGKTTALRMIAGLLRADSGKITIAGFDAATQPREVKRRLGFLTGSTALYDRLTPAEMVRYFASLNGIDRKLAVARQRELFVRLGIDAFADRRIGGLSMGMKQKVSIARTMIHDPEVVVFDEPTVGLDIITSRGIIDLIRECRDTGKTVLFSTHLMGEVNQLGDDIAILHRGKLLHNGPFDVFRDSMVASSLEDEFLRVLDDAEANENEKETTS
jgi:sodium transport system ATP-binding protein